MPVINPETIVPIRARSSRISRGCSSTWVRSCAAGNTCWTWTYHPRPLNTAVANSALQIATRFGMDVTLLCPTPEYILDPRYMDFAKQNAIENGGSLRVSHDVEAAYAGAQVVYA